MSQRDNFSAKVTQILCERVGGKCSNPNCKRETRGPHSDPEKRVSIGEAAHITAASPGGPRYNPNLSPSQRSSIDNGIWLCSNCADLIDKDESKYPVELLYAWKAAAEYDQFCIINQTGNQLAVKSFSDPRKSFAFREAKRALDTLHGTLQYAYSYWKANFEHRFYGLALEAEFINHSWLYEMDLERIQIFYDKKTNLENILAEYSLDLGPDISNKISEYLHHLCFEYSSDSLGYYENYWPCFFETLSTCFHLLADIKTEIDNTLFTQYPA